MTFYLDLQNSRLNMSHSVGLTQKSVTAKSIKPTLDLFTAAHCTRA